MCSDRACGITFADPDCESAEPIMADDGSGSDISIPSMLLFRSDSEKIKMRLKENETIVIQMSWNLPSPDDRVEYDLWSVPSDVTSNQFLSKWKSFAIALGTHAYFTPHYYIYDGIKSGCVGSNGENICYSLCTNNGRYCSTDPDNDLDHGISGADVVTESLRRMCIWKKYGEPDGIGNQFWDYITFFERECNNPDFFSSSTCIRRALSIASMNERAIDQCMHDSGGLEGGSNNFLFDASIQAQNQQGVVILPTMYVNKYQVMGALKIANTFEAICSGYAGGSSPDVCKKCKGMRGFELSRCVDSLINENVSNETKIEQTNITENNSTILESHHDVPISHNHSDTYNSSNTVLDETNTTTYGNLTEDHVDDHDVITQKKDSDFNTTIGNIDDTLVNSSNSYSTGSDYDYDVIDTGDSNSTMIDGNSTTNSNGTSIDGSNDGYNSTKHHNSSTIIEDSNSKIIENNTLSYDKSSDIDVEYNDTANDGISNIDNINSTVTHDDESVQFTNGTDIDDIHMNQTTTESTSQKNIMKDNDSGDTEKPTLSEAEIVFNALCSAHKDIASQPKICQICLNCPTLSDCVLYEKCDLGVNDDPSGN